MFGRVLLDGLFGKDEIVSEEYAFALGQRMGRRCHYGATRLRVMKWAAEEDWSALREWLLTDLPGEEPLPTPAPHLSEAVKKAMVRFHKRLAEARGGAEVDKSAD